MMKKILLTSLTAVLLTAPMVRAETFPVSVTIPAADSANYVVWKLIDGQPFPTAPETSTAINFTTTLDTANGVFIGNQYYAIDVAPVGGAGQLNVKIEYADGNNPNGGVDTGLSIKGIATVVKADPIMDTSGKPVNDEIPLVQEVFRDINNTTILASTLTGGTFPGFMRMYLGLATGDPLKNEPAAAVPFNLGDTPGPYSGTITLSVSQP